MHLNSTQRHWIDFLLGMTGKEIKARYKFAFFGFLWIVLNPVLQMLIIGFIFRFFVESPVDNYFIFLLAGLLPWNFFSYTLSKTTPAIVFERGLIQKAKFPREAIVLSIVLSNFFHSLIAFFIFICISVFFTKITFLSSLLLLSALGWILILTASLSLFLSALHVKYRDVNFFVQALLPLWFYVTPVIYSSNLLPDIWQILLRLNPLTNIIELFQFSIAGTNNYSISSIILSLSFTILFSIFSWFFFRKESQFFDDWI